MTIGSDYVISFDSNQRVKESFSTSVLKESMNIQEQAVSKLLTALPVEGIGENIDITV